MYERYMRERIHKIKRLSLGEGSLLGQFLVFNAFVNTNKF